MSGGPALLRAEVERFGYSFNLTSRERDVLGLLVNGHGSVFDIAGRLGLSENTVHNHFKNIFRRTRTRTKSGLLSLFIEGRLSQDARTVRRVPHVLLLDLPSRLVGPVQDGLQELGMQVYLDARPGRLLERIAELELDAVVLAPHGDGKFDPALAVQALHGDHPVVMRAWTARDRRALDPEATGVELPRQLDTLALAILTHCTRVGYARCRPARACTDLPGSLRAGVGKAERVHPVSLGAIGPAGAVLECSTAFRRLGVGASMQLELRLGQHGDLSVPVTHLWNAARAGGATLGVRFRELSPEAYVAIGSYCGQFADGTDAPDASDAPGDRSGS